MINSYVFDVTDESLNERADYLMSAAHKHNAYLHVEAEVVNLCRRGKTVTYAEQTMFPAAYHERFRKVHTAL